MKHTLVSFLGRVPKGETGYRTTPYWFKETLQNPVAYIGYMLQNQLKPDSFVILGTSGSMWDHLFEGDLHLGETDETARLELIEATENKVVTQVQLDKLSPLLEKALKCKVKLKIIPNAFKELEQLKIVEIIADMVEMDDYLTLDITHGFRHLPVLSLMSILYLQVIKPKIQVNHIYYGEYNYDTKEGEVHDLVGILAINQWIRAILQSEITGNYSEFGQLLNRKELGEKLSEASFNESIHRGTQARKPLREVRQALIESPLTGLGHLFQPILMEQTKWVEEAELYRRQMAQALGFLQRNDYLRATLFGFEAYLTKKTVDMKISKAGKKSHEIRDEVQENLYQGKSFNKKGEKEAYHQLRMLRNALAHGDIGSQREVQKSMHNMEELNNKLNELFETLLT